MPLVPRYAPPGGKKTQSVSTQYQHTFPQLSVSLSAVIAPRGERGLPVQMVDASDDSPVVDEFGCLELIRSKKCGSGYKDVYYRKHLKDKPYTLGINA